MEVTLKSLLKERRSAILEKWYHLLLDTYPSMTSKYLKKQKDRFLNPVAYEFREAMGGIYQALLQDVDDSELIFLLDRIVRIRAVQDFAPSEAIGFVFSLKRAIREELGKDVGKNGLANELLDFESKIDRLSLLAFDVYVRCREQLYEIRIKDIKNRISGLLKATGLVYEIEQEELKFKGDKVFI
ncbi:MAG: RsbRD N-terminal domain-containing protein [Candidatus Desulfofervidaceae bacterium]|nr:RsbRD N-terminal domain-containing protein [Candidatus Desulfofervidaceae bacterium]